MVQIPSDSGIGRDGEVATVSKSQDLEKREEEGKRGNQIAFAHRGTEKDTVFYTPAMAMAALRRRRRLNGSPAPTSKTADFSLPHYEMVGSSRRSAANWSRTGKRVWSRTGKSMIG